MSLGGGGQDNESTWDGLRPPSFVDTCVKATTGQQGFYDELGHMLVPREWASLQRTGRK